MKHNIVNGTETHALVEAGVIIKLGMDVHARQITVCRQIGDLTPQPPQVFTKERLLEWVRKMVEAKAVVHSCYEAGVMGYTLHRELVALGVDNIVVAPQKLAGPKRQKTDALDARALVERLDRWRRGNRDAFSVVRVPTPEEEQARAQTRLRDHLGRMRRMGEQFAIKGLCCRSFWATEAACHLAVLTYNLCVILQRRLGQLDRIELTTLRWRLFARAAVCSRAKGKLTLKLAVRGETARRWWRHLLAKLTAPPNCNAVGSLSARATNHAIA